MKKLVLLSLGLILPGCASVVDGTSQQIALDSNPPGADCLLTRKGETIGRVNTPGAVLIKKTKHDIDVSCTKEGYQTSTAHIKSEIQDATWGNIILGGGIGWAIDSASGADNKYKDHITVTLNPDIDALKASLSAGQQAAPTQAEAVAAATADAAVTESVVTESSESATVEAAPEIASEVANQTAAESAAGVESSAGAASAASEAPVAETPAAETAPVEQSEPAPAGQ